MPETRNNEAVTLVIDRFKEITVGGEKSVKSVVEIKVNPIISDFFKSKGTKKTLDLTEKYYRVLTETGEKDKVEFYAVPNDVRTGNVQEPSLFTNGTLNEGILRFVGVDQGMTLIVKEGVTKEVMEDASKKFAENVKKFYRDFISPVRVKINMSIEEL
jgi:hypothetical protein